MKRIAERCREEELDSSVVPVVVVQASPQDVGSAARLDFYRQVLQGLRGHVAVRDRILNLPLARERGKKSSDPAEWLEMRDAVSYALDLLKVKAVCIDEAQHLMQADAAQKPSIQLDWLKSLTNQSQLLYILVAGLVNARKREKSERRAGDREDKRVAERGSSCGKKSTEKAKRPRRVESAGQVVAHLGSRELVWMR
jgi:hypothetical protein